MTAAFGGTSQLYDTTAYEQGPAADATQATAASQPKIWDNGLSYPGLGLFDGSDDYMAADLPDITSGPVTWWARFVNTLPGANGTLFSRGLDVLSANLQYAVRDASGNGVIDIVLGGTSVTSIQTPLNTEVLVAFVYDPVVGTVTPYKKVNGVVTAGTPVAFSGTITSRPNKFIGCRPNTSDGLTRIYSFKGTTYEIGITKTALTAAQIAKL